MASNSAWSLKLNEKAYFLGFGRMTKKELIYLVVLFVVYLSTARLGSVLFFTTNSGPALIWPPAGIAIAALFLGSLRLWPAVTLAAIVNSLLNHTAWPQLLAVAVGHTLQAMVGAYVLQRFKFNKDLSRLKDMLLIFFVAFAVTMIAPTISNAVGYLVLHLDKTFILNRWLTLWLGGMLSVMILTPLVTSWSRSVKIENWKKTLEGVFVFALLLLIEYMIFWKGKSNILGISYVYLMLLPLFWVGLRYATKFMVLSMFLTTALATSGLFYGVLGLSAGQLGQRLMQVELFTIIIGVIFYILSSVSEERATVAEALTDHVNRLEAALETIRHHALHDPLTGLSNRKALEERFALAKSMAVRHGKKMSLLFLDMDRFKNINDTLGHNVGDLILKEIAGRLKLSVREVDTVARLGGDEFIIILNEVHGIFDVEVVIRKIMLAFVPAIKVLEHEVFVTVSIGAAIFPEAGNDIDILLKHADFALYRAKDRGKNGYQFYDEDMMSDLHAKLSLEEDLRRAVEKQQLDLVFQPYVDLKTDKPVGVEALVRWNHAKLGTLEAESFIPLAEEAGLMSPIGNWVLQRACRQIKEWHYIGLSLPVSINLSAKQFTENNIVHNIEEALLRYGVDPTQFELEITESIAMHSVDGTASKIQELKRMGISIAIDDFGTGYSSLAHLKDFPVQKLKIDRSFVENIITNQQDSTMIRTIISMGHTLGIKVCAEGIETEPQKALLTNIGCDLGQGYHLCVPLRADELVEWYQKQTVKVS